MAFSLWCNETGLCKTDKFDGSLFDVLVRIRLLKIDFGIGEVSSFPPDEFVGSHKYLSATLEILLLVSLFMSVAFLMKFTFRLSWAKMVFCAIAAYSIQNLMYNIASIAVDSLTEAGFSRKTIVYFQEPISLVLCGTLSFLFRSKFHSIGSIEMNNGTLLGILLLAIPECAILGNFIENVKSNYLFIYKCYEMTADLLILYLQFSLLAKQSLHEQGIPDSAGILRQGL